MAVAAPDKPRVDGITDQRVALEGIASLGATFLGRGVQRVTLIFDGGETTLELPDSDGGELTASQAPSTRRRIVEVLRSSPVPLSRKQLAGHLKLKSARGRFAQEVSGLVETSQIHEDEGMLTDDASKFMADE